MAAANQTLWLFTNPLAGSLPQPYPSSKYLFRIEIHLVPCNVDWGQSGPALAWRYGAALELLGGSARDFSVEVHCYVLMSNHFHFLLKTRLSNLDLFM